MPEKAHSVNEQEESQKKYKQPKNFFFLIFLFPLEYFFSEINNAKLVVDNALSEEIVETVAKICQLLLNLNQ